MRRLALVLVLALVGGGVLAACDGGGDDDDADDATDESTDGGGGNADDQALAEDIILTRDDVPDGFAEQESEDDEDDFSEDEALVDCVDPDLLEELEAVEQGESGGSAESAFETDELVVGSGALVMPDEELAAEFFDLFSSECFEDAFLESFSGESTDEADVTDVSIEPLEDLPGVGDAAIEGFAMEAVTIGIELSLEFVVIQSGRAMAFVFTAGLGESYPTDDRDDAIVTVAERMESA